MKLSFPLREQFSQIRAFHPSARLFLVATILDGIIFSGWGLFFNFYILERGFDREFLGLVNAVPSIAVLIFGIPIGLLSDRLGRKRAMILGVLISILCMGLQVTVLDPRLIVILAFLGGLGNSLYFLSHAPFLMKVSTPANRTLLFSLNFGLVTLSGSVGSLLAGRLPAYFGELLSVPARSAEAYQAVLLLSIGLSLFTLVPLALIRELPQTEQDEHASEVLPPLWRRILNPLVLRMALPNLLIGFGAAILIPYMNVFLFERFALPDTRLGLLFSLSALLTGFGSILSPHLVTRFGSKIRAIVFTQAASLVFLMMIGFSPFLGLVAISFLLRGTLMNMAVPLYRSFTMEQVPEREQGTVNSVIELAWQLGWAVGPYISGLVQARYGFTPLFLTTGVMYALSIIATWTMFRSREMERGNAPLPEALGAD